jgi:hypothetical protein
MDKNKSDKNAGIALVDIQSKLECPKNQYNSFSEFKYRSCEDILAALKPHLNRHGCYIVFEDECIFEVGGRIYLKTTAVLNHPESGTMVKATAQARESEARKKMSDEQLTGAASSYARKYALNALFAIDDTKDADFYDNTEPQLKAYVPKKQPATKQPASQDKSFEKCKKDGCNGNAVGSVMPSGATRYFCDVCRLEVKK